MKTDQVFEVTLCATYPPVVPQGGTKDGWSLPAILIRFLKVQIFNNVPETYHPTIALDRKPSLMV